ncbi:MAG: murein biosynthesis integral membrane protein MurJ [Acidobacteriaceae bacterium]|nr:murein biosynthesis integral membrane protein MurJ [Acidobacteriaceae bacterium]
MLVRIRIAHRPRSRAGLPSKAQQLDPEATRVRGKPTRARSGGSSRVALGILGSRVTGLIRERFIGHYFGIETLVADAFRSAIRIPNMLNTLFGEGVLSASFVTVYSKLRALDQEEEAEDLAAAIFALLSVVCAALVVIGITCTPLLIDVIAPGFKGEKRILTIHLVRILFPGTGLLVLSAWCLGVLNSHRRFLLSYLAPVALNLTMIAVLVVFGFHDSVNRLVVDAAWGYVLGSLLQFLVQLPRVLELLPGFRPKLDVRSPHVRSVIRSFGPIFLSRGVVQISALVDQMIASWLPQGAVAALSAGQVISNLPISLFSMSVSAAELPALSSAVGTEEQVSEILRNRLRLGLRRIAFFVIPSATAFLLLGDVLAAGLYQTGRFHYSDAVYLWSVLAGSGVGLLATALGRLYSSAFYALLDTRTPLRFAVIRVALTITLGYVVALHGPALLGIDAKWGVAGLTSSAGIAGWVEFTLLRHALGKRIGPVSLSAQLTLQLWSVALLSGLVAYAAKHLFTVSHPILIASIVIPIYGILYLVGTSLLRISETQEVIRPLTRRFGR